MEPGPNLPPLARGNETHEAAVVGVGKAPDEPVPLDVLECTAGHRHAASHQPGELGHRDWAEIVDPPQNLPLRRRHLRATPALALGMHLSTGSQVEHLHHRMLDLGHGRVEIEWSAVSPERLGSWHEPRP